MTEQHDNWMSKAIEQARKALQQDEVPIGAIIVKEGKIIARAHNSRNHSKDATAHAELIAIRKACRKLNDWRLCGCTMYVTLQPCLMCIGACYNARLDVLYYGANDTNYSGTIDAVTTAANTLNHNMTIEGGIMQEPCAQLLTRYFASKRNK